MKLNEALRSNMRGIRKCKYCGFYNGQRAKSCSNKICSQFKKKKSTVNFDAVQLISKSDTKIYSVKSKTNPSSQRNFVQITDIILSSVNEEEDSIISRNAICYVDNCKYDSKDDSNLSCKHVCCTENCSKKALEVTITKDVLYNMRLSENLKKILWNIYIDDNENIPSIQRLNKTTFAVKCEKSKEFPAGRLHITITQCNDYELNLKCACKKNLILLSSKNKITIENDICNHIILVLAGLLSSNFWWADYKIFISALKNFCPSDNLLLNSDLASIEGIQWSNDILDNDIELNPKKTNPSDKHLIDNEIKFIQLTPNNENNDEFGHFELADCQIELMDQFKLTNQIDLCNDEIEFSETNLLSYDDDLCNIENMCKSQDLYQKLPPKTLDLESKYYGRKKRKVELEELTPPTLDFDNWLSFVTEQINLSLTYNTERSSISHTFNIHDSFFKYLTKRFQTGEKLKLPNSRNLIEIGEHKGKMKSVWNFTSPSVIKGIFLNNLNSIEMERSYIEKKTGEYSLYEHDVNLEIGYNNSKLKKILPKIYTAYINIDNKENMFTIEWISNTFPKSNYGTLRIAFAIGYMQNNRKRFNKSN